MWKRYTPANSPCLEEIGASAAIRTCPLSARVIPLNYLELHLRSKIFVSEIQIFLLLKRVKCLNRIEEDKAELL